MKLLHSSRTVEVPEGITLEVKARQVRVKGPRGELDGAPSWVPRIAAVAAGCSRGCLSRWRGAEAGARQLQPVSAKQQQSLD